MVRALGGCNSRTEHGWLGKTPMLATVLMVINDN